MLSENITGQWQLKELASTLKLIKEISEKYPFSDRIKFQYELIIGVHHWQNTNFGLIADLKINVSDRKTENHLSYVKIKDKYGEDVKESIVKSVQYFHKHLNFYGGKYATAMREKFNLITNLLRESFGVSEEKKSFYSPDGEIKVVFKPLEVVEVSNDGI